MKVLKRVAAIAATMAAVFAASSAVASADTADHPVVGPVTVSDVLTDVVDVGDVNILNDANVDVVGAVLHVLS